MPVSNLFFTIGQFTAKIYTCQNTCTLGLYVKLVVSTDRFSISFRLRLNHFFPPHFADSQAFFTKSLPCKVTGKSIPCRWLKEFLLLEVFRDIQADDIVWIIRLSEGGFWGPLIMPVKNVVTISNSPLVFHLLPASSCPFFCRVSVLLLASQAWKCIFFRTRTA